MKKNFARVIALILTVAVLAAASSACSLLNGTKKVSGTYNLKKVDDEDAKDVIINAAAESDMTLEEYMELIGITEKDFDSLMSLKFNDDGTGVLKSVYEDGPIEFTWTQDGDTVTMKEKDTPDAEEHTITIKDGLLSVKLGSRVFTFGK